MMAGNVTLLTFAAERRATVALLLLGASRAAIDRYLLLAGPTAANPLAPCCSDQQQGQRVGHHAVT